MNIDASFLGYFYNAGLVVKFVLLLLITASIISWTYILQRAFYFKEVNKDNKKFEESFWAGGDLAKLYNEVARKNETYGLETIFQAGFKEFLKLHKQAGINAKAVMESAQRAMRGAQIREQNHLERHLPFLATVASTSPYIGLFGTVWGIMISVKALAHVQQATISMVAPGLAEALVATAIGLFAAIPASIFYNRYVNNINRLLTRFDAFQEDFSNILFRQAQMTLNKADNHERVLNGDN